LGTFLSEALAGQGRVILVTGGPGRGKTALLNAEPNRLAQGFRATLFHRTQGHPQFTIEMLHAMQKRGDLLQDPDRFWIEGM
jgi:predicted ATPase